MLGRAPSSLKYCADASCISCHLGSSGIRPDTSAWVCTSIATMFFISMSTCLLSRSTTHLSFLFLEHTTQNFPGRVHWACNSAPADHIFRSVRHEQTHRLTLAYSQIEQSVGKGIHQCIQLPVRQVYILEDNSDMFWVTLRCTSQHLGIQIRRVLKRWTEQFHLQVRPIAWRRCVAHAHLSFSSFS